MYANLQVKGLKKLNERLNGLSIKVRNRISSKAVKKAAILVQQKARLLVPKDTGKLANSIVIRKIRSRKKTRQAYKVGILSEEATYVNNKTNRRLGRVGQKYWKDGDAYYGKMIEFGYMQRHSRVNINGRWITLKNKKLPSPKAVPARPFLRPALGTQQQAVVDAMKQELEAGLMKEGS